MPSLAAAAHRERWTNHRRDSALILRTWWTAWCELVQKLVALVASFASMAGLLVAFLPSPKDLPCWAVRLLVLAAFAFIVLVVLEFFDRRGRRVYTKSDAQGIRRYMHEWIEHGGRVAIWTRDMSWAQNPETRQLLTEKARRNELILCLPEVNELAAEPAKAGAEGDTHVIDECSAGGHPACHLAADLVTLARALQGRQNR